MSGTTIPPFAQSLVSAPRPPGSGRFDYVKYDDHAVGVQEGFKAKFEALASAIEAMPSGRATSLALTALEEVYMWIGKSIRDDQVKRNGSAPLQEGRVDQ